MGYGGVTTAETSSAASVAADDTHLIYDDCPGSRALMAQAAKHQQQRELYSFHSLPHYRHASPGPTIVGASFNQPEEIGQTNLTTQQNASVLPYGHQSANSTPRRTKTSLSQTYLADPPVAGYSSMGDNSAQSIRNSAPLQRKQQPFNPSQQQQYSPHPSHAQRQLQDQISYTGLGLMDTGQDMVFVQRRGSNTSGKAHGDMLSSAMDSQCGSRTTLPGAGGVAVHGGGSISSRTESNTVVEKMDYQGGGASLRSSNKSATSRSQTSLGSGGSFAATQVKDSDEDEEEDAHDDDDNAGNMSSEDNLSHESYELIEKENEVILQNNNRIKNIDLENLESNGNSRTNDTQEIVNKVSFQNGGDKHDQPSIIMRQNNRKGSNQFEEEFYRQANSSVVTNNGAGETPPLITSNLAKTTTQSSPNKQQTATVQSVAHDPLKQDQTNSSSSKMSSRCSLNSSSILSPPPQLAQLPVATTAQKTSPPAPSESPEQTSQRLKLLQQQTSALQQEMMPHKDSQVLPQTTAGF